MPIRDFAEASMVQMLLASSVQASPLVFGGLFVFYLLKMVIFHGYVK